MIIDRIISCLNLDMIYKEKDKGQRVFSPFFVQNCGKENFGTLSQLESAINRNNHKHQQNKEILIRLVNFWKSMEKSHDDLPREYEIGGQWLEIINESFSPLVAALDNEDLDSIQKQLANLFRNFGDFFGEPTNYSLDLNKRHRIERFKIYSSRWFDLYGKESVSEVIDPEVGNPVGFLIDQRLYTQGNFINNHFARRIQDLVSDKQTPVVCEIGGGFGGLAYHLINRLPGVNYIDFDIPLIALVSAYYLLTACPEANIGLYGEFDDIENPLKHHNIVIAPNFAIRSLKDNLADICFNKCSFAEMDKLTVVEYMNQFERICKGYILHMNHSWEPNSKNAFYQPQGEFSHWNISEVEPSCNFKRIYKIPAPFQSDFHGEFFEWLYEKK